jgi:hypothetical protein
VEEPVKEVKKKDAWSMGQGLINLTNLSGQVMLEKKSREGAPMG